MGNEPLKNPQHSQIENHLPNFSTHTTLHDCDTPHFYILYVITYSGVHRVLVGKPEGKTPLGKPRHRWEDNIKMDLQEVGGGHGDWKELAQDRDRWRVLVGMVRDFRVS